MNATPNFSRPDNEVELRYEAGSAEWAALQPFLKSTEVVEVPAFINGKKIFSNDTFEIRAPHDQSRLLARVHRPSVEQIKESIAGNLAAARDWAELPFADRAAIMHRAAAIIADRDRHRINAATMLGQSKTIEEAEPDSACELIDFLRFNTTNAQRIYNDQPPSTRHAQNRADWRPLEGFIYGVSPFNFTAIGTGISCTPAIMGNVVLWKPSDKSALSNWIFYEALLEAGLPPGVINFVPGEAVATTDAVFSSRDFAGLHFTGSSSVFRSMWARAAGGIENYRTFPRLVGETGGKDFVLAHPSANADEVAVALVRGAFGYGGQKCSAASRTYIPKSLWPAVRERMQSILGSLKVGDVAERDTYLGAVIDRASWTRLSARIDEAKNDSGVKIVAGGKYWDEPGFFIEPTVIEVSDPLHALMRDELFGPILAVYVYEDAKWSETLPLIDSTTAYALTGSIFSTDRAALLEAQRVLINAVGNLYINDKPTGAVVGQHPFGGGRASGTNDKAGSYMNLLRWTSARVVKETYAPARGF
ncbi:L-glutamate gamma-semialdehyde dehydrogenase [Pigmentiphaga aceris]|uniref:L-glutamate gamma-semialdehyde dehydrogenase n=1 Tax=Pigmentiphaga aceris TaxID=1940612 RepID=A0A5C0AVQ8_9BURK|nr:L-glutamate gamma-semialdehyde dehydrogenase [Pigmentiphaga aceris]QEI04751.1 L-glutamate gamma-semialdehyde dehydrogenase [Pigmentiphaga aceris]